MPFPNLNEAGEPRRGWLGVGALAFGLGFGAGFRLNEALRVRQMTEADDVVDEAVRERAIEYIQKHWGKLGDLPKPLIPVIWVTVYKALEIAMRAEAEGGPKGLVKNMLVGDRRLMQSLQEAIIRIKLLQKIIPIIRSHTSSTAKLVDAQLIIDILKWGIEDAGSMSGIRRTLLRQFAKADPEYDKPIPLEIDA